MALPLTAPTVSCTLSPPLQANGTVGMITSAYLSMDRPLVWAASGETIYEEPISVLTDPNTTDLSFDVIPVDTDGVFDLAGNMVANWVYSLRVSIRLSENTSRMVEYSFQPTLDDGPEVDLDLHPQTGFVSEPPVTVPGQTVNVYVGDGGLTPEERTQLVFQNERISGGSASSWPVVD